MTGSPTRGEAPSQRDQFRRLSILIAIAFVDMLGAAIVFPMVPLYAIRFQATPVTIGLVIAAFSIAQLLGSPLWGRISDHYGRRPALLAGLLAATMGFTIFGFANAVWVLFVSRLIQGAGGGMTGVTQAYVSDSVPPGNRAKALGWLSAATNLGVMIGPAIGSLAFNLGPQYPGLIAAALCLVNAWFAWRWLPESNPPAGPGPAPERKPVWHAAWQVVRHPKGPVPRMIWIYAAGMLGLFAMTSVLALYLNARFGVSEATIGYVFLYVGALSVIMRSLLLGPILHRLGEPGTLRVGTILLTLGLLAYPLAPSWWVLAPVMALIPIGTALLFPATTALMSHASEPAEVGTTMGVAQTFAGISRVIAPLIATWAFQEAGHAWPFLLAGTIVAMVGVLAFRLDAPAHALRASKEPV
ncbi:MAG TPA: MFS transporter [Gemmatimonadales bacterium]|nr:MFS transporter [Gemmatimonadales bacterium]